jgi:hypothetical protein
MMRNFRLLFGALCLMFAPLLTTCSSTADALVAAFARLVSGSPQSDLPGHTLPQPLVVMVTSDTFGTVVPGVPVTWAVESGGGSLSKTTDTTAADGLSSVTWTLGPTTGTQTVSATAAGLTSTPVGFIATALTAPPTQISLVSGNSQTATVNTALPAPLVVKVGDASNAGVAGVTVFWTVTSGGGTRSAAATLTNASGLAQINWTLGVSVGTQTATATVLGLTGSPVTFTATGTAVPTTATQMSLASGSGQSGTVNTALAAPLIVKVGDASNVGVAGVTVDWTVTSGGGAVSAATSGTNGSGQAQVNWTLGATVGAQTATAAVAGLSGSPVTFTATAAAATVVQRFISPVGSDASSGQTPATAWRTFAKAFGVSGIPAGGELIVLDGTYSELAGTGYISYVGTGSAQPPSGKSHSQQTWVHAQNPGNVTVIGALFIGRSVRKDSNITIQGITFEGGGNLYNTNYVTIRGCGFHDVSLSGGNVFGIGTGDGSWGNSYNLIEDSWVWGQDRLIAITYRGDHNVWRRVVLRGDGCNSAICTNSGAPNVGITVYESSYTELQNVFVVDRILGGGTRYADFASAQHTAGQPHGGNRWRGIASINSEDDANNFEYDNGSVFPVMDIADFVAWNPGGYGVNVAGRGGSEDVRITNITVFVNSAGDGIRVAPGTTGTILTNLIVFGAGLHGINSALQPSYSDVFGTWSSGSYNQTTCATGCRTTNPTADGATPSLKWPLRIEAGSALSGTGAGAANYGATIVNRFGTDGTHWGEAGYGTLTATPLWPWPNQAIIRAQFCNGVTRGWCGTALTFTQYVWGQLGNGLPPGINPLGPSRLPRSF